MDRQELGICEFFRDFWWWFRALRFTVLVCAEVTWEIPVKFLFVNRGNVCHLLLGKDYLWSYPQDTSNVGPSRHVWAVHEDNVSFGGFQKVPGLIMGWAHVDVENVDLFPFLNVWELPGLLEVFCSFFEVKIIAVSVWEAWSLHWTFWSNSLSTPLGIIDHLHLMDVLARVAVPEFVMAVLLPPLTIKARQWCFCVNFRRWAGPRNWSESHALIVHGACKELVTCCIFIGKGALCGAVLEFQLSYRCVVVIKWNATFLAETLFDEVRIDNCFSCWCWAMFQTALHVDLIWVRLPCHGRCLIQEWNGSFEMSHMGCTHGYGGEDRENGNVCVWTHLFYILNIKIIIVFGKIAFKWH